MFVRRDATSCCEIHCVALPKKVFRQLFLATVSHDAVGVFFARRQLARVSTCLSPVSSDDSRNRSNAQQMQRGGAKAIETTTPETAEGESDQRTKGSLRLPVLEADRGNHFFGGFVSMTDLLIQVCLLVIVGVLALRNEPFTPAALGGSGSVERLFEYEKADHRQASASLAAYHILRFGYLMEGWIFMDGFQYPYLTMHHIATAFLIVMSLHLGTLEYGSVIILCHDLPNIFTQSLVLLTAVREGPMGLLPLVLAYLSSLFAWSYYMLWFFPYNVLYAAHSTAEEHHSGEYCIWWQWHWVFGFLLLLHHVYVFIKLLAWVPSFVSDPKGSAEASSRDKTV